MRKITTKKYMELKSDLKFNNNLFTSIMKKDKPLTALALFSGGLDSILAVKIIQQFNIKVIPLCFCSPFFDCKRAKRSAEQLNFDLRIIDLGKDYLELIKEPKYGYGKNFNPCIDCHAFMFKKAGSLLNKYDADFIISGEVLGQRPKSQKMVGLLTISKNSGYKDLIIRPLSQKLLPDTMPIRLKWLDKEKLYDLQGRSRKPQLKLAKKFNIVDFPSPAGGCLLTDKNYCRRLYDLIKYDMFELKFINLLKIGRHFRISDNTKLVLSRNKTENDILNNIGNSTMIKIKAPEPSPLGILNYKSNKISFEEINLSASILLRYIRKIKKRGEVYITYQNGEKNSVEVEKIKNGLERKYMI